MVNGDKAKYLLSSNKQSANSRHSSYVTVDSHNFKVGDNVIYLGTSLITMLALKYRGYHKLTTKRCYFRLSRQLKSKVNSRRTTTKLYKSLIIPDPRQRQDLVGAELLEIRQTARRRNEWRAIFSPAIFA